MTPSKTSLISIIVPVYNIEVYLKETLLSILNQTYLNYEVLLVDDGSTDSSPTIISAFIKDLPNWKYFRKENAGQASARNYGISRAKGEFIALIDADDLWHIDKLKEQISCFQQNPKIGLCYTQGTFFYNDSKTTHFPYPAELWGENSGEELFIKLYSSSAIINSSVVFKKSLWEKAGGFDEHEIQRGTEDWDLWLKFAKNNATFFGLQIPLIHYRVHDGGIHLQNERMYNGKIRVYEKYDSDSTIPKWIRTRQYRYVYRELLEVYRKKQLYNPVKDLIYAFKKKDSGGITTTIQFFLLKILPLPSLLWLSRYFLYRIGYRLEKIGYQKKQQ